MSYGLPWWVWALPALAVVLGLTRLFGWRVGLGTLGVLALVLAHRRGAQRGWAGARAGEARHADEAVERAAQARSAADLAGADAGRLRDTDGWRRD
ncbi:hypothetical protein [Azorhizobium oxalatiphilum]|uniref:hypothetical protein n=1 Tax=Azorhizobium oxalatiphilum TaxID=980631 RepID=UPI001665C311|nr:hypothetical protein [Azorhizobium oxalatiphilum]